MGDNIAAKVTTYRESREGRRERQSPFYGEFNFTTHTTHDPWPRPEGNRPELGGLTPDAIVLLTWDQSSTWQVW